MPCVSSAWRIGSSGISVQPSFGSVAGVDADRGEHILHFRAVVDFDRRRIAGLGREGDVVAAGRQERDAQRGLAVQPRHLRRERAEIDGVDRRGAQRHVLDAHLEHDLGLGSARRAIVGEEVLRQQARAARVVLVVVPAHPELIDGRAFLQLGDDRLRLGVALEPRGQRVEIGVLEAREQKLVLRRCRRRVLLLAQKLGRGRARRFVRRDGDEAFADGTAASR